MNGQICRSLRDSSPFLTRTRNTRGAGGWQNRARSRRRGPSGKPILINQIELSARPGPFQYDTMKNNTLNMGKTAIARLQTQGQVGPDGLAHGWVHGERSSPEAVPRRFVSRVRQTGAYPAGLQKVGHGGGVRSVAPLRRRVNHSPGQRGYAGRAPAALTKAVQSPSHERNPPYVSCWHCASNS